MKKYSTSQITNDPQIKTTMEQYFTHIRITKSKKKKSHRRHGKTGDLVNWRWHAKWGGAVKISTSVSKKYSTEILHIQFTSKYIVHKRTESRNLYKYLYYDVHSSITKNTRG